MSTSPIVTRGFLFSVGFVPTAGYAVGLLGGGGGGGGGSQAATRIRIGIYVNPKPHRARRYAIGASMQNRSTAAVNVNYGYQDRRDTRSKQHAIASALQNRST